MHYCQKTEEPQNNLSIPQNCSQKWQRYNVHSDNRTNPFENSRLARNKITASQKPGKRHRNLNKLRSK